MFEIIASDANSRARVGRITTQHGVVDTPAYAIVGTNAEVRAIKKDDLPGTKTQIVIVNTYHMWRDLGDVGLNSFEGLHRKMSWDGPLMTDSGGFQVFSLGASREHKVGKVFPRIAHERRSGENLIKVMDDGVLFYNDGEELYLNAEKSVKIQEQLGADIIVAFDECTSPSHDYEYNKKANRRTHAWAERSLKARTRRDQIMLGVVQGGVFEDLRRESAKKIGAMHFEGYAIGGAFGSSYGSGKNDTFRELDWVMPHLPEDRHRHLLGIGKVDDIFECIMLGVDTFDCVIPTREARHGGLWTRLGRIDITRGCFNGDKVLIDDECLCHACSDIKITRGELNKLFREKDQKAGRFATIHNIFYFNDIMSKIRAAITDKSLNQLRDSYSKIKD